MGTASKSFPTPAQPAGHTTRTHPITTCSSTRELTIKCIALLTSIPAASDIIALQSIHPSAASRTISTAESIKRKLQEDGKEWYQYNALGSVTVDWPPVKAVKEKKNNAHPQGGKHRKRREVKEESGRTGKRRRLNMEEEEEEAAAEEEVEEEEKEKEKPEEEAEEVAVEKATSGKKEQEDGMDVDPAPTRPRVIYSSSSSEEEDEPLPPSVPKPQTLPPPPPASKRVIYSSSSEDDEDLQPPPPPPPPPLPPQPQVQTKKRVITSSSTALEDSDEEEQDAANGDTEFSFLAMQAPSISHPAAAFGDGQASRGGEVGNTGRGGASTGRQKVRALPVLTIYLSLRRVKEFVGVYEEQSSSLNVT